MLITDPTGALTERRNQIFHGESDLVTGKIKLGFRGPGSAKGNLTLSGTPYLDPVFNGDTRARADGDDRSRVDRNQLYGFYYDISGDYDFRLGPGRLKLIGLRHLDHEPLLQTQTSPASTAARPIPASAFGRNSHIGETVGRAEYSWKTGKNALAGVVRARVQFARPARVAVHAVADGQLRPDPVSRRVGQGRGNALRRHRDVQPPARPQARPPARRSAPKRARWRASTATSRRANSSGPRAACRSAGGRRRAGTPA